MCRMVKEIHTQIYGGNFKGACSCSKHGNSPFAKVDLCFCILFLFLTNRVLVFKPAMPPLVRLCDFVLCSYKTSIVAGIIFNYSVHKEPHCLLNICS